MKERIMKTLMLMMATLGMMLAWTGESQAADPVAKCKVCHTFDKGAPNKTGPNLFGVFGRKAGMAEGFNYSPVMKTHAWTWDEEHLRKWVCNSPEAAKEFSGDSSARVRMPPQRKCGADADAIIAFLKTLH
jgi:cytochrome c